MNSLKVFLPVLILFFACQSREQQKQSTSEIVSRADSLLNNWHKAAAEANYSEYFGAMDSTAIFIGTDATEVWDKTQFAAFSKPYFDSGKAWDFKVLDRNIFVSKGGEVAWFDEILDTWMGTCRGSGVLERHAGSWKIKHYVLSMAIPNDDIDAVIQVKSKNDSIFLKNFLMRNK